MANSVGVQLRCWHGGGEVTIPLGETVVGRGPLLQISADDCSRKQAVLTVVPSEDGAGVVASIRFMCGANFLVLHDDASGTEHPVDADGATDYRLEIGARFCLGKPSAWYALASVTAAHELRTEAASLSMARWPLRPETPRTSILLLSIDDVAFAAPGSLDGEAPAPLRVMLRAAETARAAAASTASLSSPMSRVAQAKRLRERLQQEEATATEVIVQCTAECSWGPHIVRTAAVTCPLSPHWRPTYAVPPPANAHPDRHDTIRFELRVEHGHGGGETHTHTALAWTAVDVDSLPLSRARRMVMDLSATDGRAIGTLYASLTRIADLAGGVVAGASGAGPSPGPPPGPPPPLLSRGGSDPDSPLARLVRGLPLWLPAELEASERSRAKMVLVLQKELSMHSRHLVRHITRSTTLHDDAVAAASQEGTDALAEHKKAHAEERKSLAAKVVHLKRGMHMAAREAEKAKRNMATMQEDEAVHRARIALLAGKLDETKKKCSRATKLAAKRSKETAAIKKRLASQKRWLVSSVIHSSPALERSMRAGRSSRTPSGTATRLFSDDDGEGGDDDDESRSNDGDVDGEELSISSAFVTMVGGGDDSATNGDDGAASDDGEEEEDSGVGPIASDDEADAVAAMHDVVAKGEDLTARWNAAQRSVVGSYARDVVSGGASSLARTAESKRRGGASISAGTRPSSVVVARTSRTLPKKKKSGKRRGGTRGFGRTPAGTLRGGTKVRIDRTGKVVVSNATPSKLDITLRKEWRVLQRKEMAEIMMERLSLAEEKRSVQRTLASKHKASQAEQRAIEANARRVEGLFKQLEAQRSAMKLDAASLQRARMKLEVRVLFIFS